MSWIAVAIAGSAVVGAVASNSAASKQAKAAREAAGMVGGQSEQTRQDLLPWQQAGRRALTELEGRFPELLQPFGMEQFQQSPAYQFNLQQGQQALDKAAAKRGTYYAPATMQDLSRFSQGLASQEFQNAFGNYQTNMDKIWQRLYGMSGTGQNAAAQAGGFGAAATGSQAGLLTDAAAANAAGMVGGANAITGGVQNWQNQNFMNQILARNQQSSVSPDYYSGNAAPF